MPKIIAAAHAFPPHSVSQQVLKETAGRIFAGRVSDLERLLAIFDNSRIESRQFMMPTQWYLERRTPQERNQVYQRQGLELIVEAARNCLAAAGCAAGELDHVIFVSSTGHATPSLDAHLINRLGLRPSTSRAPIWGLGCAAGAAGLSRAFEHCKACPDHRVLLVALECCSLAFSAADASKRNLVASSLFADGAAAALVVGELDPRSGPAIVATRSHLFPDSYRIMGWDFLEEGMQLVLSPKLPLIVRQELPRLVTGFLEAHGLEPGDLAHYITHPGGARVMDAYRDALRLSGGELGLSEDVLRLHGNVSSVSVLVVLERWLAGNAARTAGHGLLSAFGPGFSAELLLLRV
ncbi:MAG: hypothetical protein HYV06_03075 [Deltaproteobacteria bacterium]|nr:hypothetical protein [Deltaproteobacteria bacterium]